MTVAVDPGRCWIRHVHSTTDPTAVQVGGARMVAELVEGAGGRQGWISAEVTPALSDSGEAKITLPNTVGDDGILHRQRFRILTDARYRVGDEWIEIMREPHDAIAVVAITAANVTASTIELSGRTSEVLCDLDPGPALERVIGGPHDLVRRAGMLAVELISTRFVGGATGDPVPTPWATVDGTVAWADGGEGLRVAAGRINATVPADSGDTVWEASCSARVTGFGDAGWGLRMAVQTADAVWHYVHVNSTGGTGSWGFVSAATLTGRIPGLTLPGEIDLRIVHDGLQEQHWVNGTLVAVMESAASPPATMQLRTGLNLGDSGGAVIRQAGLRVRRPILSSTGGDRRLAGIPTPGGLRGRYYDEGGLRAKAGLTTDAQRAAAALAPDLEPVTDRLDPQISFSGASTWKPDAVPADWFSVRWAGAIWLDLATSDRQLRITGVVNGRARLWIGRTDIIPTPLSASGTGLTATSPALRAHLDSTAAGWWPVIIEYVHQTGNAGITLQDSPLSGGTPTGWATVPTARLSPYGVFDDVLQHETRRKLLDDAAASFGVQWRVEPATLESGDFPGRLVCRPRQGRDTDLAISLQDSTGAQVSIDALDAADRILADAAGLPIAQGGQLTAEVLQPDAATAGRMMSTGVAESLADITEPALLAQRAATMLALRGSPNEQVSVQPPAQRQLVDTFPLTGALARLDWRPGDAVRLALPELGVVDEQPRQIIRPTWTLVPGGVQQLTASFRQRPRNVRTALRALWRTAAAPQRTPQGQLSWIVGALGSNDTARAPDAYSRCPIGGRRVVRGVAVVETLSGTGTLEVNGVAGPTITAVGTYDITAMLPTSGMQAWARLTGATSYQVRVMLLVQII